MIAEKVDLVDHGITKWSKVVGLVLLGWFASSAYHGTLVGEKAKRAVPVLQAEAGCEHWRADVAKDVAKKAITAANEFTGDAPSVKAIPRDCPHPPVSVPK